MRFSLRSPGFRLAVVFVALAMALAGILSVQVLPIHAASGNRSSGGIAPNSRGEMDCNGWSTKYSSVKPDLGGLCTDPIAVLNGKATRFLDNGWYVGHDEPSVKFISSAHGSGNNMTYLMQLAVDPHGKPTVNAKITDYAELSPAPWFGLPICDAKSYPQNPCTPDSDSNSGLISDPNGAGSAFMELQFYPPGFQPFIDGPSCDATHYCAALTIDSLECTFGFASCNGACIEPVNFAYLQRNGVPAGPPSPQLTDVDTFTPNSQTLLMNQGDKLVVTIQDTHQGLKTSVVDLSTGQVGFMVASAANGFMNTNIADCTGTPFDFHAEYDTAQQQNQVPWAALEGGVLMQDEVGHFETCSSVANQLGFAFANNGQSFSDPNVYQTCIGGAEGHGTTGEGCDLTTFTCANAETQGLTGPQACPTTDPASGALCEFSDANCMPAGPRPVTSNGKAETISWPISGCQDNAFQNGDLDFDGNSYIADWPDGSPTHPTPFRYLGPFDAQGQPYPSIQFETDAAGSEFLCNVGTGSGCTAPPLGAAFYPFWTIGKESLFGSKVCLWNFGNVIAGQTTQSFGGAAEYGSPDVARYGGTLTSPVMTNPQFSGACKL